MKSEVRSQKSKSSIYKFLSFFELTAYSCLAALAHALERSRSGLCLNLRTIV
ncbi:hypothetical protein [Merismopedia glauca]|uniref:hypothetical protein n=1 Tax=Merismopedia glauca TaxID=292586 RepID=UPI0015E74C3D|nr:hypothetical protein [Merismopedia glauca]